MAYQGAIGRASGLLLATMAYRFPLYAVGRPQDALRQDGYYLGRCTWIGSGEPIAKLLVTLHWHDGKMVDRTWTDDDGYYRFDGLAPTRTDYYVVPRSPDGSPIENAQVKTHVTPAT